jgi:hypothetical protein
MQTGAVLRISQVPPRAWIFWNDRARSSSVMTIFPFWREGGYVRDGTTTFFAALDTKSGLERCLSIFK